MPSRLGSRGALYDRTAVSMEYCSRSEKSEPIAQHLVLGLCSFCLEYRQSLGYLCLAETHWPSPPGGLLQNLLLAKIRKQNGPKIRESTSNIIGVGSHGKCILGGKEYLVNCQGAHEET